MERVSYTVMVTVLQVRGYVRVAVTVLIVPVQIVLTQVITVSFVTEPALVQMPVLQPVKVVIIVIIHLMAGHAVGVRVVLIVTVHVMGIVIHVILLVTVLVTVAVILAVHLITVPAQVVTPV